MSAPDHGYPVVVGDATLRPLYGVLPWELVLRAGKIGRDGLRVINGNDVRSEVRPGECAWREITTQTWGKVTGLLYLNIATEPETRVVPFTERRDE